MTEALFSDSDDIPANRSGNRPFADVAAERISRRGFLKAAAGGGLAGGAALMTSPLAFAQADPSSLTFQELPKGLGEKLRVAKGYSAQVLIRWGDPVLAGAPAFDPIRQNHASQAKQFGYNNDFIAYLPLPAGSASSDHGLLAVNHEYTIAQLMFPNDGAVNSRRVTEERARTEMAAHGHSVVEIRREAGMWRVVPDSDYARRITAGDTEMRLSGPAAGHKRLRTGTDGSGTRVTGTLNNCSGGVTPWGTVLIAEENFHGYFHGKPGSNRERDNFERYGLGKASFYGWQEFDRRFLARREPHEANRFGWIVEYDPYDSRSTPVKRTALGRFKHESATAVVNPDGRVVVYSGDDQQNEYIYRFVSEGHIDRENRAANRNLLDEGTLYAARFNGDGTLTWLPLVWNTGPLTRRNGFGGQAEVLIETRRAADLLGATPMDRPEDVEPNPVTGRVYAMLTNNSRRIRGNFANPRPRNRHGHIVEMIPPGAGAAADHAAGTFTWEMFLRAGSPFRAHHNARYHDRTSHEGWLSGPDNCAFDNGGRLWIATDSGAIGGFADGLWATDTLGDGRALTRHFLSVPRGAELCGPAFTPDNKTLFVAVQHPGDEENSGFDSPSTRWPDFDPNMPPRPSVVAITHDGGKEIGS